MKPDFDPIKKPSIAAKRPSPELAARNQDAAIRTRSGKKRSGQWQALALGGLVIGAVFVGLEISRTTPEPPVAAAPETTPQPVAKVETTAPPAKDARATAETANVRPGVPIPLPEEAPIPQNVAIPPANEAELLGKESALVLTDLDSRRDAAIQRDKRLFERAIEGKAWNAYRGLLAKSIDAGMLALAEGRGVNRFDAIWKEPVLYQAFLRWQLLGRLSEREITEHVIDTYSGEMLIWLCSNTRAMEEFLLTIKPGDDGGKVLQFLTDAWPNTAGMMEKYFPLALACAVVFDRDISISNPVSGSKSKSKSASGSDEGQTEIVPMQRFMWYIEKNEKGQFAAPVHHSSARDLVWVVCAPVSTSELEWSLDKMHITRKTLGQRLRHDRVSDGARRRGTQSLQGILLRRDPQRRRHLRRPILFLRQHRPRPGHSRR